MRTTLDIADPVLKQLKRLQKQDGRSMGQLVSDLLVVALEPAMLQQSSAKEFDWFSRGMQARIDLADAHAVWDALDSRQTASKPGPHR